MCGYNAYNADVCEGDSGGPMTIKFRKNAYQIGVVSYGHAQHCGLKQ